MMKLYRSILFRVLVVLGAAAIANAQALAPAADEKAEAVLKKAIQNLGGDKYLNVKTQIGRGRFSLMKDGVTVSFQSFTDVIVFPDKERTDFKGGGGRSIQTNVGNTGWTFDNEAEVVRVQDNLLRGKWRNEAKLTYIGKRPATLGRRNDVVRLIYDDGLAVEFEFSADEGFPVKSIHTRTTADGEEFKEEDRYAQFVDVGGIRAPFIIDRFTNGAQTSRINYETIEYNRPVPDSIFAKPANLKDLKKDLKL